MTTRTISLALIVCCGLLLSACSGDSGSQALHERDGGVEPAPVDAPEVGQSFAIPSGRDGVPPIRVTVAAKGDGMAARAGDTVAMHYTGTFLDGTKFDSSRDRGVPFEFRLGAGRVIHAWDLIVARMHTGDRWTATVPSALAYGTRGAPGGIPPNSDLIFDMELLRIR